MDENNDRQELFEAAMLSASFFVLSLSFLINFCSYRRASVFNAFLGLGALFEMIGYMCRALFFEGRSTELTSVIQFCVLLCAPTILSAGCFCLGDKIIEVAGKENGFPVKRPLSPTFVAGSFISLILQYVGSSRVMSDMVKDVSVIGGRRLATAGLCIQWMFDMWYFVTFVRSGLLLYGQWYSGARRRATVVRGVEVMHRFRWCIGGLFAAYVAIMGRTFYRIQVFHYAWTDDSHQGRGSTFFVCESMLILWAVASLGVRNPAIYLKRESQRVDRQDVELSHLPDRPRNVNGLDDMEGRPQMPEPVVGAQRR